MAFRVRRDIAPDPTPKAKPKKDRDYLSFIHTLPCVVTGGGPVQAAHLSYAAPIYGHYGRGKGRKASDRWVLPLIEREHTKQHSGNELAYWRTVGINPYVLCLSIHGLWSDLGDDAHDFAARIIWNTRLSARPGRDFSYP